MKRFISTATLLFFLIFSINAGEKIKIGSSTVLIVKTQSAISGKNLREGQMLFFAVAADLKINGKVVVKSGAPVIARVATIESAGMIGQGGSLEINFESTTAVDGSTVNLTGSINSKGESSVGGTIAVAVVLCPLALLASGKEGSIPSGAQTRALTLGETEVNVD